MSTDYFINAAAGSDSTGDGTRAKPWKSFTRAIGAGKTLAPAAGDRLIVAPGTYRETLTVGIAPTGEFQVVADVDGSLSGVAPGEAVLTAFTADDATAPAASPTITTNGKDFLTWKGLTVIGGNTSLGGIIGGAATSHNWKFLGCTLKAGSTSTPQFYLMQNDGVPAHWLFDSCRVHLWAGRCWQVFLGLAAADYDADVAIRNCKITCPSASVIVGVQQFGGSGTGKGGGVRAYHNTLFGAATFFSVADANIAASAGNQCEAHGNLILGASAALSQAAAGQLLHSYNRGLTTTPYAGGGMTAGTGDAINTNFLPDGLSIGEEAILGTAPVEMFAPKAGSTFLGVGTPAGAPATDLLGRPRPAGGGSTLNAAGCLERHDTARKETTIADAGSGWAIVGPGDQDIRIAVDAVPTSIRIKYRSDADAAPTAQLLADGEVGVAASAVQVGAAGQATFATLTLPTFTPTAKGVVTLRLTSGATTGSGAAYFDSLSLS